jgi:hypothetical protein
LCQSFYIQEASNPDHGFLENQYYERLGML